LYVLDCGSIHVADTARYELRRDEGIEVDDALEMAEQTEV
jgi:hypothetical protein